MRNFGISLPYTVPRGTILNDFNSSTVMNPGSFSFLFISASPFRRATKTFHLDPVSKTDAYIEVPQ
jgi:hypothetical protein